MKIRRFVGKDYRDTVALVKKELGADAVILSAKTLKKGFGLLGGRVEITAALDVQHPPRPEPPSKGQATPPAPERSPVEASATPFDSVLGRACADEAPASNIDSVLCEVRQLRRDLLPFLAGVTQQDLYPLVRRGIDEQLAAHLVARAGGSGPEALKPVICGDLSRPADKPRDAERVVVFAGPTGVGKTTTLAKVAAGLSARGRRPMLTTFDTVRPGGVEQLRSFADKLGVSFKALDTTSALFDLLTHTSDPILVDTPGRSPGDGSFLDGLLSLQFTDMPFHTHMLLSAGADPEANLALYRRYERLRVDSLVFTKVDEGVRFGSLYNLAVVADRPVAYLTTGQRVPDDIAAPSPEDLAHLILEGEATW